MPHRHIITNIGHSPLPVLVTLHRLCRWYEKLDGELPMITPLDTAETKEEVKRIQAALNSKLGTEARWNAPVLIGRATDAAEIERALDTAIKGDLSDTLYDLCYAGGRKSMAVAGIRELVKLKGEGCADSYLDPARHCVVNQTGELVDKSVIDERKVWDFRLAELAELHGFTRDFKIRYDDHRGHLHDAHYPADDERPGNDWVKLAEGLCGVLKNPGHAQRFAAWRRAAQSQWKPYVDANYSPNPKDHSAGGVFTMPTNVAWGAVPTLVNKCLGAECWSQGQYDPSKAAKPELAREMIRVLNGKWLELAGYSAMRRVLPDPVDVFWAAHIARRPKTGPQSGTVTAKKDFEIDCGCILGYHCVVVSSTASSSEGDIKHRCFEVLTRARQAGGVGAQAILLTAAGDDVTDMVRQDVEDFIGADEKSLEVWDRRALNDLPGAFHQYFQKRLKWS